MQSIFKPAVKLMNKLKYPRKFALIFILFLIPVTALLAFTIKSLNDDVTTSINQRNGLEYNIAVRSLIQHIQQHRGLSSVYLGGQTEVKDKITLKEKDIQEDIKKIDELDTLYGNQLNTTAEWSSLKGEWDNLKNQVFNLALKDSTERHTALISRLLNFTSNVADTSGLILTNKLDSFYLVDTIINKLPHTTEYMGQARATGAGVAGKKAMTKDERFKLLYLTQSITETLASTDRGMNIVYNNHPGLKSQLGSTTAKAMESSRKLVETIGSELLNKENITLDSDQYYSYATGVIDDIYALINQESAALTEIEGQQSNQALFMRNLVIGLASLILLSVLYLFVGFYMAVIDTIRVIEGSAAKIAEGDLSLRISHSIKDETKSILDSLNKVAEAFAGTVIASKGVANEVAIASEGLSAITEQVAEAANQVTQSIQEVAEGSESQLQGTEGVAAVIDEIARGIQAIAENSTSVSEAARKMELEAEAGNESISGAIIKMNVINASVKESNDTILSLGERSQSIGQIIESITNIASQTNLLALNAAIEAARAGEHGRGFAVVADEVRKLAEQSSQSANQITEIIKGIQGDTESSVKKMNRVTAVVREGITAVDEAGRIFERILSSTKSVSGQVEEVSAASEEISASSEEVAASVTEVSKIARESSAGAQNVAAASEEQLASMQEVSSSAISLLKKSEELNKIIERFKV